MAAVAISQFALTADGDLDVSSGNLRIATDIQECAVIWLTKELGLFLATWFLDLSVGFPWLQEVLGHKPKDFSAIKSLFRGTCMKCPNAVSADVSLTFADRTLTVPYTVKLLTGSFVEGQVIQ